MKQILKNDRIGQETDHAETLLILYCDGSCDMKPNMKPMNTIKIYVKGCGRNQVSVLGRGLVL